MFAFSGQTLEILGAVAAVTLLSIVFGTLQRTKQRAADILEQERRNGMRTFSAGRLR